MKFFMNFPVTDTSHTLAEYRTRFGYQALEKALSMAPGDVTKEVAGAGLLGHGGAAFPAGRKWGVVKLDDGEPHYVCMNADEGEPGTFKDRTYLERDPHRFLEGMLVAAQVARQEGLTGFRTVINSGAEACRHPGAELPRSHMCVGGRGPIASCLNRSCAKHIACGVPELVHEVARVLELLWREALVGAWCGAGDKREAQRVGTDLINHGEWVHHVPLGL